MKTSQKGFPWQSREIKIKIKIKLKLRLRLRYHAPVAGGMGLIPDQKTKLLYASWCGQKTSQKKESYISKTLADTLMMVHSTWLSLWLMLVWSSRTGPVGLRFRSLGPGPVPAVTCKGYWPMCSWEYRPAQHLKMLTISLNKAGGIITFNDTQISGDGVFICLILGWKPMKFYRIELHFSVFIWIFHMVQNIN